MNITLIGMAGSGKSYVGQLLAQALGYAFVDTDITLENRLGAPLQEILNSVGEELFLKAEADEVIALGAISNTILAPGGSIMYSPVAIEYLKVHSRIVYLIAPPELIESRIDVETRGIVGLGQKSFSELQRERSSHYASIAELTIDTKRKSGDEIVAIILQSFKSGIVKK